jgi:hypothetical protein
MSDWLQYFFLMAIIGFSYVSNTRIFAALLGVPSRITQAVAGASEFSTPPFEPFRLGSRDSS